MNDTGTFATVSSDRCDLCGKADLGLDYHHLGCPVLFACRGCHPKQFVERASQFVFNAVIGSFLKSDEV